METDFREVGSNEEKSISECFDEALKTFEEISNCELATNSSEVQVGFHFLVNSPDPLRNSLP